MPAPIDGVAETTALNAQASASASNRLLESVQDRLNDAAETVKEHPYLTSAAIATAAVGAFALSRGRTSRATGIAIADLAAPASKGASKLVPSAAATATEISAAGISRAGETTFKLLSAIDHPILVETRPMVRLVSFDPAGGLKLVSADVLKSTGGSLDLFPHIPKLTVTDPMLHAAQLVTQFDGNLARLYARAQKNAVHLEVMKASGENWLRKEGTGFFVNGNGEIATAYHVVRGGEKINVYSSINRGAPLAAEVTYADEAADLALLQLRTSQNAILSKIRTFGARPAEQALIEGEQVVGFGFPNGASALHAMPGNFSLVKEVQLGPVSSMRGEVLRSFMMANPGSSGSAIVDRNGKLLSMIVQQNAADMTSLSVPIGKLATKIGKLK